MQRQTMREFNLKIEGNELIRQANQIKIEVGPQPQKDEVDPTDSSTAHPEDDALLSNLPAAIRGAKRFMTNLAFLEVSEQILNPGTLYEWDGIGNEWRPARYQSKGINAIGYAAAPHKLQFWGLANIKEAVAGRKLYLSAQIAGNVTSVRTNILIGVGVSKGTAMLNTLKGLL